MLGRVPGAQAAGIGRNRLCRSRCASPASRGLLRRRGTCPRPGPASGSRVRLPRPFRFATHSLSLCAVLRQGSLSLNELPLRLSWSRSTVRFVSGGDTALLHCWDLLKCESREGSNALGKAWGARAECVRVSPPLRRPSGSEDSRAPGHLSADPLRLSGFPAGQLFPGAEPGNWGAGAARLARRLGCPWQQRRAATRRLRHAAETHADPPSDPGALSLARDRSALAPVARSAARTRRPARGAHSASSWIAKASGSTSRLNSKDLHVRGVKSCTDFQLRGVHRPYPPRCSGSTANC